MSVKNIWVWMLVAAGLFAASVFHYRRSHGPVPAPAKILPQLRPQEVTNVQVRLEGQLEMRAERTAGRWEMSEPVRYPADGDRIEKLLASLETLTPAVYISRRELMGRPNAEEEYGFPQATIVLKQGDYRAQLFIGSKTTPGNQVFLQVVGDEGIYVVDADLLTHVPQRPNDWRDLKVFDLREGLVDRIAITNGGNGFELQREGTNNHWRIVTSDFSARAESSKVGELLKRLGALQVQQFVSDAPRSDLDGFGLQPPEFECAVTQRTNVLTAVQFGKSPTNDATKVYARRGTEKSVLLVQKTGFEPWPTSLNFRDPHLVNETADFREIEVTGLDRFRLVRTGTNGWRVIPQNFAADSDSVRDLLISLGKMQVAQFVKDVVPEQAMAEYGLDIPKLEYVLSAGEAEDGTGGTNQSGVGLRFGIVTNQQETVYARRTDEASVYAVRKEDFLRLASAGSASWQFRERRIWRFPITDLATVTIEQGGQTRKLIRRGDHRWSLAPGSPGVIEEIPVEETLLDLVDLSVRAWVARANTNLAAQWFTGADQKITLEFKNGEKRSLELSGVQDGAEFGIAQATLDGEPWIFAIPGSLRRDMSLYLSIPRGAL